jgi:hypothetical protein
VPGRANGVDLWVMGVEVNQGFQEFLLTDLARLPGHPGQVRSDEFEMLAGKPVVIRVYVGLRAAPNQPATPPGGVLATGHVRISFEGGSFTLQPLETTGCTYHLAQSGGQSCRGAIGVYPGLGRQGLRTRSDYDLDLIDQRADWGGTLNFVLPAEATATRDGPFAIEADVEPLIAQGFAELADGDNRFRADLARVVPARRLMVRLVRVGAPGFAPPTRSEADSVLRDILRLVPFAGVDVVSDTTYEYGGTNRTLKVKFLFITIRRRILSQCQTLWSELLSRFGVETDKPVLALTPAGAELLSRDGTACANLGAWVPGTPLTSGRSGGVALARMPAYAGDAGFDLRRVIAITHELYHAHFDRRHVSNSHGEASGCDIPSIIGVVSLGKIDTDCWKPSAYPHGVIGAYPEPASAGEIIGDRGGIGLDIRPVGDSWALTLYDPCPTGRLDRGSPLSTLVYRVELSTGESRCRLPDNMQVHDFMSYGPNRWISRAQFMRASFGTH